MLLIMLLSFCIHEVWILESAISNDMIRFFAVVTLTFIIGARSGGTAISDTIHSRGMIVSSDDSGGGPCDQLIHQLIEVQILNKALFSGIEFIQLDSNKFLLSITQSQDEEIMIDTLSSILIQRYKFGLEISKIHKIDVKIVILEM
ncbi:hypothetical protein ACJ72_08404 [Emergomyces africanus]|uniref:Uncharacterized protein n=1 Tax=Emergomyces africanus TaxID=1955775 RepID=A0A1B7NKD5_9EURO|nr:hypothetical protein ACJ72_08404 [Emergomyces africanus]